MLNLLLALRQSGHGVVAAIVQAISVIMVVCINWYDVSRLTFTLFIWT